MPATAWWGLANAGDRNRLEGFLRRAQKAGYYNNDSLPTVAADCDQADEQLFSSLQYCRIHPLRQFLPPERNTPYGTRSRPHNYYLPQKSPASMNVIICFVCYINTVRPTRLAYRTFFL